MEKSQTGAAIAGRVKDYLLEQARHNTPEEYIRPVIDAICITAAAKKTVSINEDFNRVIEAYKQG